MKRKVPVSLVIADTGPLISLAVADRLDLLQSFGAPVFVTDAVMHECIRMQSKPGAEKLAEWFRRLGGNQVRMIATPFGPAYLEAARLEDAGFEKSTKNFGEWATSWVMDNLDAMMSQMQITPGTHYGLVLSEDKDYMNGVPPHDRLPKNTHFLSTRALFVALERLGLIPSAEDLRQAVRDGGRTTFSRSLIDRPYRSAEIQTDYEQNMRAASEDRVREFEVRARKSDDDDHGYKPKGPFG